MEKSVLYGFFVFSVTVGASNKEVTLPLNERFEYEQSADVIDGSNAPTNTPVEELEEAKVSVQDARILTRENFASQQLYAVGRFRVSPYKVKTQEQKKEAKGERDLSKEESYDEQDLEKVSQQFADALKINGSKIDCKPGDFFKTENEDGL